MDDEVRIQLGVPDELRREASRLYCKAFGDKLGSFLGTVERSSAFLASGLVRDRAFVALRDHRLVGIAGFKLQDKGLFEPTIGQFWREYGLSTPFRLLGLVLLDRKEEPDCLLMDGIAVRDAERGRGIGTRLLRAIEDHARSLGRTSIRLDVIDRNVGARRLYERFGFKAERTESVGPLSSLFGFQSATTMRKDLGAAG